MAAAVLVISLLFAVGFLDICTCTNPGRMPGRPCDVIPAPGCSCKVEHGKKEVTCHGVEMTDIPDLNPSNDVIEIEVLEITGTDAQSVPAESFSDVTVRKLYLPDNKIRAIEESSFVESESVMTYLDLSHNLLTSIPNLVGRLKELRTLVLTDNLITTFTTTPWEYSDDSELRSIFLDYNPVDYASSPIETHFWTEEHVPLKLEKLVISLTNVPDAGFLYTTIALEIRQQLKVLIVSNTHLGGITLGDFFTRLEYVGFDYDGLQDDTFSFLSLRRVSSQLRGVSLVGNLLTAVPDNIEIVPNLEEIDLSENTIASTTTFSSNPNLKVIKLRNNLIENVAEATFNGLPDLEFVDLSGNLLEAFNPYHSLSRTQLSNMQLLLGDNPMACTCRNRCLISLLQEDVEQGEGPFLTSDLFEDLVCEGSEELVVNTDLDSLGCCMPGQCCLLA